MPFLVAGRKYSVYLSLYLKKKNCKNSSNQACRKQIWAVCVSACHSCPQIYWELILDLMWFVLLGFSFRPFIWITKIYLAHFPLKLNHLSEANFFNWIMFQVPVKWEECSINKILKIIVSEPFWHNLLLSSGCSKYKQGRAKWSDTLIGLIKGK